MNSITKRWAKGNLLLTVIILLLAEGLFAFYTTRSYIDSTRRAMLSRLDNISGQLSVAEDVTPQARAAALRKMVNEFSESGKFELMLINRYGTVVAGNSTRAIEKEDMPDVGVAIDSHNGLGEYRGNNAQGEQIFAISTLVPYATTNIAVIRLVVSMSLINNAVTSNIFISFIVIIIIFIFSLLTGLFFVNSIVIPIANIEKTATEIAAGDFSVRIENSYNDEIGRLCDTINNMAINLSQAERLKNDFISSVSHELRTPLTSIKGWVETLERISSKNDIAIGKALNIIGNETDRLSQMVEELLDFSRIQNKGLSLNFERIDLVAELSDAVLMVSIRAQNEEISIDYDEPQCVAVVFADKNRLRQVFLNILDNAIKYSPPKNSVNVGLTVNDNEAIVTIKDSGCGITQTDLPHVKERFYKGINSKKGSGIGLAVAGEIIGAHSGKLTIDSVATKGTTVTIIVPVGAVKM